MNIFCYPGITYYPSVLALMGQGLDALPQFGFKPRTPLLNARFDNTEVDMKLGHLLVEAKLTETDFQMADPRLVHRYRDLEAVFEVTDLPLRKGKHVAYQLIRGVLAAFAMGGSFCVLCDSRRPSLSEDWYSIMRCVRPSELRCNLMLLTWQELSSALPYDLQSFLMAKYGITPAIAARMFR